MATKKRKLNPVMPGEILDEQFIRGYPGMTAYRVAKAIGMRPTVVYEVISGKRSITVPIAMRLGRYFGNTPEFWINLQVQYEMTLAKREYGKRVEDEVTPLAA